MVDRLLDIKPNHYETNTDEQVEQLGHDEREGMADLSLIANLDVLCQQHYCEYNYQYYTANVKNCFCFLSVEQLFRCFQSVEVAHQVYYKRLYRLSSN